MIQKRNDGYFGKIWCLLTIVLCLSATLLAGEKTKAANQNISLGTQGTNEISVKKGDVITFSLNTGEQSSVYYSIREEIASVSYDLADGENGVLAKQSDTVFRATGVGTVYLTVSVKNQAGEEISQRSYCIVSTVDMSGVTFDRTSLKI